MLRRTLHAWLEQRGLTAITDDVVLAAYEAMANSVEHAYSDVAAPGPLTVTASHDSPTVTASHNSPTVTVTITDTGEWLAPVVNAHRGRGLELASAVSDRFDIDHGSGHGTTVVLGWDVRKRTPDLDS